MKIIDKKKGLYCMRRN